MTLPPKLDLERTLNALDALLGQERDPPLAPKVRDCHRRSDPIREVFARLGDRWSVLLLLLLRTSDFRHATLPTNPPGVVYSLSAAGHGLAAQVDALMSWTREHSAAILAAQQRYGAPPGE